MRPPKWAILWAVATALVVVAAVVLAMTGANAGTRPAEAADPLPPSPSGTSPRTSPSSVAPPPPVTPSATPAPAAPTSTKPAGNLASRLTTLPAGTSQVIIVHADTYNTTHATLETFTKVGGVWKRAFAPMNARIGSKGFSDHHLEYVPNTPVGVYGFGSTMYGIAADPGVAYAYHVLVPDDWWNENPDSAAYNTFQHVASNPGGASETLWKVDPAYWYFAFIKYNVPAVAGKGSGIFLHVATSGPTAGCVSLPKSDLVKVLTWLDPSKSPRIVLSPDSQLRRF